MASQAEKQAVGRRAALLVIVTAIFVVALVWWRITAPQAEPGPADARWSWMLPEDPVELEEFKAKVLERKAQWANQGMGGSLAPAGRR